MDLQTKDPTTAKRKLARLVAALASGELVAEAQAKATAAETYRSFTMDRHDKRVAAGVVMAPDEKNNREEHIYPIIGDLPLGRVTDDLVRHVLDEARDKGLGWETVRKIRAVMSRDLKRAKIDLQGRPRRVRVRCHVDVEHTSAFQRLSAPSRSADGDPPVRRRGWLGQDPP